MDAFLRITNFKAYIEAYITITFVNVQFCLAELYFKSILKKGFIFIIYL